MKNIFILFLVLLTFSCSNEPNYEKIGQELCDCMQPMLDLTNKITAIASDSTKTEEVKKMIEELEALNQNTEKCVEGLSLKYPELEQDDSKAEAAFKETCPEVAEFLEE